MRDRFSDVPSGFVIDRIDGDLVAIQGPINGFHAFEAAFDAVTNQAGAETSRGPCPNGGSHDGPVAKRLVQFLT